MWHFCPYCYQLGYLLSDAAPLKSHPPMRGRSIFYLSHSLSLSLSLSLFSLSLSLSLSSLAFKQCRYSKPRQQLPVFPACHASDICLFRHLVAEPKEWSGEMRLSSFLSFFCIFSESIKNESLREQSVLFLMKTKKCESSKQRKIFFTRNFRFLFLNRNEKEKSI